MEFHPRIDIERPQLAESRIILGSFPTFPYTLKGNPKPMATDNQQKPAFFYGSERNRFWHWYREFIDHESEKAAVESLLHSLKRHQIGITDAIYSCERKGQSSSDTDLTKRVYNHRFFRTPATGETIRILCTSKGVMNNMLLIPAFFSVHTELTINKKASEQQQHALIAQLGGTDPVNPIIRVLDVAGGGTIECRALPSPGSPYRSLKNFGFVSGNAQQYLHSYLETTFSWFLNDV